MKTVPKIKLALFATVLSLATAMTSVPSASASDRATCKVVTNDIGTIQGRGPTVSQAFEDAATQCFDRRSDLYRMKKGTAVDEDSAMVMIDLCANLKCDS